MLNTDDLNFNKKVRWKKSEDNMAVIPKYLFKRDCVRKYSEIFDPTGKIAAILGWGGGGGGGGDGMKLDISVLHEHGLDWNDPMPSKLKTIWAANFDLMREIGNIKFHRAVVPEDAISFDIETIETADAGEKLICAAIYARFKWG